MTDAFSKPTLPISTASAGAFPCASLIKEIGRGANGARALPRDTAHDLYAAMLDGSVSDIELGAVLMAYRIKGEAAEELAGMLHAAHAQLNALPLPAGPYRPVSIPSYNGARKQRNLTPLLAGLLAKRGVPVVVHGVRTDAGRVTSAEIFTAMGVSSAESIEAASEALGKDRMTFVPIDILSPALNRLLNMRKLLGVRNSTHTLVKLLNPFIAASTAQSLETSQAGAIASGSATENATANATRNGGTNATANAAAKILTPSRHAIRLVNYTHPPYRDSLAALFTEFADIASGDILLARGTEGEAVADTRRQVQVDWLHDGKMETLLAAERSPIRAAVSDAAEGAVPPPPPALDAAATAAWIHAALNDESLVPEAILRQVDTIMRIAQQA